MRPRHLAAGAVVSAAVLVLGGCDLVTDPARTRIGPEARRLSGDYPGMPAWSADSRSIYYTLADGRKEGMTTFSVNAVDVANGRTRTLARVPGFHISGEQVHASADPSALFVSILDGNRISTIHRLQLQTGDVETVTRNAGIGFLLSGSGNRIAHRLPPPAEDIIWIRGVAGAETGQLLAVRPDGHYVMPLALSPEGRTLVYRHVDGLFAMPVEGGPATPLASLIMANAFHDDVWWHGEVPHLLGTVRTTEGLTVIERNGGSGVHTTRGQIAGALAHGPGAASPGGRSWAVWAPMRVAGQIMETPVYHNVLYAQAPGSSAPRALLNVRSGYLSWFAFSPDGRHIGLRLDARIYVVDVR
jgi:hypothetical protein